MKLYDNPLSEAYDGCGFDGVPGDGTTEQDIREYFTEESLAKMFGDDAEYEFSIEEMIEAVLKDHGYEA